MLHVATVMRNAFSVFNVWHRLVAMLDAYDDERVPRFQTYLQVRRSVIRSLSEERKGMNGGVVQGTA